MRAARDLLQEFIVLADPAELPGELAEGMKKYSWLRVLRMGKNGGQSAAFDAGFKAAQGEVIATIDAV